MRVPLALIHQVAPHRLPGYVEAALAAGRIDGDTIEIPDGALDHYRLPSIPRMAANYAAAQTRDILAGRPRRSPDECNRILREHCETCAHFRASDRRCSLCGCPVGSKIPMAREHCPIDKW